jgi:hypothetical protein
MSKAESKREQSRREGIELAAVSFIIGGVVVTGLTHWGQHELNGLTDTRADGTVVHEFTISRSEMLENDALTGLIGGSATVLLLSGIRQSGIARYGYPTTEQERWNLFDD